MPAPRYSVVIAAFNAERTITSAIESALSQTATELEVVVVNDGSVDATAEIVQGIPDSRVRLLSTPNQGPATARNAGIAVSRGKYVSFLDSDDLWLPEYLELAGAALDEAENPGFAYTDAYVFDSLTGRVRRQSAMHDQRPPSPPPRDRNDFLLELLKRNFVFVSTTVPRSVLDDVDGWDQNCLGWEDYNLWLRIVLHGHDAVWVPGKHALYRVHPGQRSRQQVEMRTHALEMLQQLSSEPMPTDAHRELLARRLRYAEREVQILNGEAPVRHALRTFRHGLGWLRQRLGLAYTWYGRAPREVASVFPDLKGI